VEAVMDDIRPFDTPGIPPNNLPKRRNRLIGRQQELARIVQLLLEDDVGLITLTGAAGTGKTRLALGVAAKVADSFPDGVWFVSLVAVTDPELIAASICRVLELEATGGLSPPQILKTFLRYRRVLLVLDNLEHLLDGANLVSELLEYCDNLKVLITSREALRLTTEHEFHVNPLALPRLERTISLETLKGTPAIALFVERAKAVKPDFAVTEQNARDIAEICIHLDGLPLSIELATARLKMFSESALLARLDRRLEILTGGARDLAVHQRSLRATISWSYDLLNPRERHVFNGLSVFSGDFSLDAAAALIAGAVDDLRDCVHAGFSSEVLNIVSSLVEKSLLHQSADYSSEPRFSMLETIREFALERLHASGNHVQLQHTHARYYRSLVREVEPELFGSNAMLVMNRLEQEHDNFRIALQWSSDAREWELAMEIATALSWFWYDHGHIVEGRNWLEQLLAKAQGVPERLRARALVGAGGLAHRQLDLVAAVTRLEEGLALSRSNNDAWNVMMALTNLGLVKSDQGDLASAQRLHEECLGLCREIDHQWGIGVSLTNLGWTALFAGDLRRARDVGTQALTFRRDIGDKLGVAYSLYTLARVSLDEQDVLGARSLLLEAMQLFGELGERWGLATCLETLAISCVVDPTGTDDSMAARLWGAADAQREIIGSPMTTGDRVYHARYQNEARSRLQPKEWDAAWQAGRMLSIDDTIAEVEAIPDTPETGAVKGRSVGNQVTNPAGLTIREIEVLQLVAQGLSNRRVAEQLYLSPRTVGQHLRSIYNKIGVGSRAAATRYAVENKLI
jgi:predicted ATPase/DNA-binding CsgD family transcriptional regulator